MLRQRAILNTYPRWKYWLIVAIVLLGILYALPNLYGDNPAIQISGTGLSLADTRVLADVQKKLTEHHLTFKSAIQEEENLIVFCFNDTSTQLEAQTFIKSVLGPDYTVALNLMPATPAWLQSLGAAPMKLGLDLRGGVHFLLAVDVQSVLKKRLAGDMRAIGDELRHERIRYAEIQRLPQEVVQVAFRTEEDAKAAYGLLRRRFSEILWTQVDGNNAFFIQGKMNDNALIEASRQIIEQVMTVLRNRVNELGVAEPIIQQQGRDRVAVDLPGIQDSAQAKQILGGTATLEFHLVDDEADPVAALKGAMPAGSRLYRMSEGQPIVLKSPIVLQGSDITSAAASTGENGRPAVNIMASGVGVSYFSRITGQNVGKRMAIVYVETKAVDTVVNDQHQTTMRQFEHVISAPVIQSRLGRSFVINNMTSFTEAQNLAIMLRSGALPANINIIEESTVGPSLGKDNIHKGYVSVVVSFCLIVVFMAIYYRWLGVFANLTLGLNLILLIALMSLLGMTLTLPGIAGIVLTLGIAVDANVLIYERIREELRLGISAQAAIHAGFERAFTTIVDANVTTLIVAVVLFAIGTGSVRGFAITLTVGILASMFTAITVTRGLINLVYGGRAIKQLSIGIRV